MALSPPSTARYKGGGVGPSPAYSYSAAVAEVIVDPDTGWVTVPKIWIAHDIGRSINPTLVIGQVEGGVYMGLGEALMEAQEFRPKRFGVHKDAIHDPWRRGKTLAAKGDRKGEGWDDSFATLAGRRCCVWSIP